MMALRLLLAGAFVGFVIGASIAPRAQMIAENRALQADLDVCVPGFQVALFMAESVTARYAAHLQAEIGRDVDIRRDIRTLIDADRQLRQGHRPGEVIQ